MNCGWTPCFGVLHARTHARTRVNEWHTYAHARVQPPNTRPRRVSVQVFRSNRPRRPLQAGAQVGGAHANVWQRAQYVLFICFFSSASELKRCRDQSAVRDTKASRSWVVPRSVGRACACCCCCLCLCAAARSVPCLRVLVLDAHTFGSSLLRRQNQTGPEQSWRGRGGRSTGHACTHRGSFPLQLTQQRIVGLLYNKATLVRCIKLSNQRPNWLAHF